MRFAWLPSSALGLIAAVAAATAATLSETDTAQVRVAVVAPADDDHLAWAATAQLQRSAGDRDLLIGVEPAPFIGSDEKSFPDVLVMPVRSLATQVPALQILELPFFYRSLGGVHERLDGALGESLAEKARKRGWEIVAYWDEGMHVFSGLKRYDQVRNLMAREFLIIRPDPVAEKQFQYWKADARRIRPENRAAVLRECLLANRAATLQEVVREELYQVHFDVSLTNHRYEGWVAVAPVERWAKLDAATRERLSAAMRETTIWQRDDAREREAAALAELKRRGMTINEVDAAEREAFRKTLPDWTALLPDTLDAQTKRELIALASTGTAAVAGPTGGASAAEPRGNPAPDADSRQGEQRDH